MTERRRVLLAGVGDLFDEVHEALEQAGAQVRGLKDPDDAAVRDALEEELPDVVCVVAREDALPLRLALLVRHLAEDVPLVVTVFDREMAAQLETTVPHLRVVSLADVVAPSLAAPCLDPDLVGLRADGDELAVLARRRRRRRWSASAGPSRASSRLRALVASVFTPYDHSAALLFYGAMGLAAMLAFETGGSMVVLDQSFADAFYGSTKSLATVGPNDAVAKGPSWFKVAIAVSMMLTLLSAACFTGGLINRLVDSRLTALIGRRAVPRRDHVVVVGLGQVGLRLCVLLRECGIPVVAIDTEETGRERRAGAAAEAAGGHRPRRQPGGAAAAVARPCARAGGRDRRRPRQRRGGDGRPLAQRGPAGGPARGRRRGGRRDALAAPDRPRASTSTASAPPTSRRRRSARTPRASRARRARATLLLPDGGEERFPTALRRGLPSRPWPSRTRTPRTSPSPRSSARTTRAGSPTPASRSSRSTRRTTSRRSSTSASPASSPSPAASTARCTASASGRCASTPATPRPASPTSATSTCSSTGRRA